MGGVYLISVWPYVLAAMTLIGAAACGSVPVPEARPLVAPAHVQGGEWFAQTGCTKCHSVSVYGLHNLAAAGPDLSIAVEDVPRRFGRSLDDFFKSPSGTMSIVLSTVIPMTSEEKRMAVDKLKEAYRRQQEAVSVGAPVASH